MSLEEVRAAAEHQATAHILFDRATRELHEAIREAKVNGWSESELAKASGLTRQRVWQITKR